MKQNKLIIGLTGGSGCGKSVVSKAASDLGFIHIDTDKIGHNILLKPSDVYY
ncbi:MAG: dephospho-CoA kinase, partial [Clostridia bacterium]|nr:dephospho-CoA kinase [Clostridia bacterium]